MVTYASYTQTNSDYDYAINGVPFFSAASADAPYGRTTADWQRQQQDQSTSPGEQSLNDWWRRSQASFHYGAGLDFFDPAQEVVAYGRARTMPLRFQDSRNINPWVKGQVTMLRGTSLGSVANAGVRVPVRGFATSTHEGVVYSNAVGTVRKYQTDGTAYTISGAGGWSTGLSIFDIDVDGSYVYVMNSAGVYVSGIGPSGSGSTAIVNTMTWPSGATFANGAAAPQRGVLRVVKDRLVICADQAIFNAVPGSGAAMPSAFYKHPNDAWVWTGVASSGDAIFYSGYAGNQSAVFASILETASAGSVPTVSIPFTVAELPPGETILSMITYLNTYIVLGTSQGVRVGLIGNNGQIQLGPLSVQTDLPVNALTARGSFVWAGGQSVNSVSGLYRLDLSSPLSSDELRFPWCRDLESTANAGTVTGIAPMGLTDRLAFGVTGNGLWVESASTLTGNDAWIATGRIRFDTWEDKIFQYLKVQMKPNPGTLIVTATGENDDSLASSLVSPTDTTSLTTLSVDGSDGIPHQYLSYLFDFTRSSTDATKGPIFKGYQVLAQPANVRQRSIRLALLCFPKEMPTGRRRVERPTFSRITGLEQAERKGAVVKFQDFGTGESRFVRIEKTEFVAQSTGEQRWDRQNPGGILLVTLTTVD